MPLKNTRAFSNTGHHLFYAHPQLAGNSNLNIECLLRAIFVRFNEKGMLPLLHVQVAS